MIKIQKEDFGERIDKFLANIYKDHSRTEIQKLIKKGEILINKNAVNPHYRLQEGDKLFVDIKDKKKMLPKAEKIDLDIVYEDEQILVINKPSGMVVHPTSEGKHFSGTLVNALLNYLGKENLSNVGGEIRPGILHRIDKDTSGLLIVTKNNKIHEYLVKQMKARTIEKIYTVLVLGEMETEEGTIDAPLSRARRDYKKVNLASEGEGRNAITKYKVEDVYEYEGKLISLIKAKILTGRTHQIRVHFAALKHPVIGDELYGNKEINQLFKKNFNLERFFLHATELKFKMPGNKTLHIKKDLPDELKKILKEIK